MTPSTDLTQNVRHLRGKLALLAVSGGVYLAGRAFELATLRSLALIVLAATTLGLLSEAAWGARGEEISGPVRRRFLVVSAAAVALYAINGASFAHKGLAQIGLGVVIALCSIEVIARLRGRLRKPTAPDYIYVSVAMPAAKETTDAFAAFLERYASRVMLIAEKNPLTAQAVGRFLICVPRAREAAVRAYINQTLKDGGRAVVRDLKELPPHERLFVERWAATDGVDSGELELDHERELPELADVSAYQLRFTRQKGSALLWLSQGEAVLDTIGPELKAAAMQPEVSAAAVILDLVELTASAKRDLTESMRAVLDDGSGSTLQLGASASIVSRTLAFLVRNILFVGVPMLLSLMRGFGSWVRTGQVSRGGAPMRRPLVQRQEPQARPLTEQEREVAAVMKKKAEGRILSGAAFTVVLPAPAPAPADAGDEDRAFRAQRVAETGLMLARAVEDATADARTGGSLEARPLDDPRRAFTGELPHRVDSRFLLTTEEAASICRPLDRNAAAIFELDEQNVPLLDAPAWMQTQWRPGLMLLGEVMPDTDQARPVYMKLEDLSGSLYATGRSGSGKSTWLEGVLRDMALAPYGSCFSIDPNSSLNTGALLLLAQEHPEKLADERVVAIDWADQLHIPYWNPLVCRDERELAVSCGITLILVAALNVGSLDQLTRGKGYLEAGIRALAEANLALYRAYEQSSIAEDEREFLTPADLRRFFTRDEFRELVLRFANMDICERFDDLVEMKDQEKRTLFASILHRLDTMVGDPHVALMVDSPRNAIDWKRWIGGGYTVLHNLNVFSDTEKSSFGMLPTLLAQYFRESELLWKLRGEPTGSALNEITSYMVADEIQNLAEVAGDELGRALEMLRKTGVRLIGASQFQGQMSSGGQRLAENMKSNLAHRLSFMLPSDSRGAEAQAIDLGRGIVDATMLSNLPRFHAIGTFDLTRPDGSAPEKTDPFTFRSVDTKRPRQGDPTFEAAMALVEQVKERGRGYGRPRAQAEQERRGHVERISGILESLAYEQTMSAISTSAASPKAEAPADEPEPGAAEPDTLEDKTRDDDTPQDIVPVVVGDDLDDLD
jgi:hypothetical protein